MSKALRLLGLAPGKSYVMGILNVTPDSFSDGGNFLSVEKALRHARTMEQEGAAIIDIGGESTRPGAPPVSVDQELDRVIPVIEAIRKESAIAISIDTSKATVMREAVNAGATMINDVCALRESGALTEAASLGRPVCLMHMQGQPRTMQVDPHYQNVVDDIIQFFEQRISACEEAGISRDLLLLDPGIGFGKTLAHNLSLLKHLDRFAAFELPLLIGVSRKSMFGKLMNKDVDDRLFASIAAAVVSVCHGAVIVRAHDVAATVDALTVCDAIKYAD